MQIITFKNTWKRFKRGRKLLLKEVLLNVFSRDTSDYFWALKNVSFNVNKGETVGIIGENGSGKSTILKLIAGVMGPDKGKVDILGRVSPLIELGAGFHPELSGRENVFLNGTILGMKKDEIEEKFDQIVEFAELKDFIDTPIKHYSSGMYMRLGFSIAVHNNPDILLVDEILSVGDERFQKKSFAKMNEFKKRNATIIFVSHNLEAVETFCDRAIILNNGALTNDGKSSKIIKIYKDMLLKDP